MTPLIPTVLLDSARRPRVGPVLRDRFVEAHRPMSLSGEGDHRPIAHRLDACAVTTPEYSFPAAIRNVIDQQYPERAFEPVTSVSYGASTGGISAVEQLRLIFPELCSPTRDTVTPRDARATLHELGWWARALRTARPDDRFAA